MASAVVDQGYEGYLDLTQWGPPPWTELQWVTLRNVIELAEDSQHLRRALALKAHLQCKKPCLFPHVSLELLRH